MKKTLPLSSNHQTFAKVPVAWLVFVLLGVPAGVAQADDEDQVVLRGAELYRQQCAECHGENGEGTELDYPYPLQGEKTVEGLTQYVDKEMPAGFPEECVGEDAEAVSRYVYDAFYSSIAQAPMPRPESSWPA